MPNNTPPVAPLSAAGTGHPTQTPPDAGAQLTAAQKEFIVQHLRDNLTVELVDSRPTGCTVEIKLALKLSGKTISEDSIQFVP